MQSVILLWSHTRDSGYAKPMCEAKTYSQHSECQNMFVKAKPRTHENKTMLVSTLVS